MELRIRELFLPETISILSGLRSWVSAAFEVANFHRMCRTLISAWQHRAKTTKSSKNKKLGQCFFSILIYNDVSANEIAEKCPVLCDTYIGLYDKPLPLFVTVFLNNCGPLKTRLILLVELNDLISLFSYENV